MSYNRVKIPGLGDEDDQVNVAATDRKLSYDASTTDFTEDVADVECWGGGSKDIIQDMGVSSYYEESKTPKNDYVLPSKEYLEKLLPTKEQLERLEVLKVEHTIEPYDSSRFKTNQEGAEGKTFRFFCKSCRFPLSTIEFVEVHVVSERHVTRRQNFVNPKSEQGTPYVSQMQLTLAQMQTDEPKRPLVGLSEVIEFQNSEKQDDLPVYTCLICKSSHTTDQLLMHLEGTKHKMFYLKTQCDPSFVKLMHCPQFNLNHAVNSRLIVRSTGLMEKMQTRILGATDYNAKRKKTELLALQRSPQDETFLPTKTMEIKSRSPLLNQDAPQQKPSPQKKKAQAFQSSSVAQGPQKNKAQVFRVPQTNKVQVFKVPQKNKGQVFQMVPQNSKAPKRIRFDNPQQQQYGAPTSRGRGNPRGRGFGPRGGTTMGNRATFPTGANASYFSPQQSTLGGNYFGQQQPPSGANNSYYGSQQSASPGNMVSTTTPSFPSPISSYDKNFLQSLTRRTIQSDEDAQFLMDTVNALTKNLIQYKIRKMPPQLKETLMMAAMHGGTDGLANLMEVSSQNNY